ncbi:MAG: TRAP transporter TatT component family protein [Proteobacteria bacterium]|nr:TRAP transporter TatT component family protein [Pseudomonadota bacterium]
MSGRPGRRWTGRRGLVFGLCLAIALCGWGFGLSAEDTGPLARADAVYGQRAIYDRAVEAAALYRRAAAQRPDDFGAWWKLARSLCWLADHGPRERKQAFSEEAVAAAGRAVALKPEHPAGYFWRGTALGFLGDAKGFPGGLSLLKDVRESMETVIRLDPGFEEGGAWLVLGRLDFFLPSWLGGDGRRAIVNIETALRYGPRRWVNHLFLAEAYFKADRLAEARSLLRRILEGPAQPGFEPEYQECRGEAEYWLAKIDEREPPGSGAR